MPSKLPETIRLLISGKISRGIISLLDGVVVWVIKRLIDATIQMWIRYDFEDKIQPLELNLPNAM